MSKEALERARDAVVDSGDPALLIALAQAEGVHRIADALENCCQALTERHESDERKSKLFDALLDVVGELVKNQ